MLYTLWTRRYSPSCWPVSRYRQLRLRTSWAPYCPNSEVCRLHRTYTSAVIINATPTIVTPITLPSGGTFCLGSNIASNFYMFWIPVLAFECLLCGLALFKGLQTLRSRRSVLYRGRLLMVILVRDSILYFFAWVDEGFILFRLVIFFYFAESAQHIWRLSWSGSWLRYVVQSVLASNTEFWTADPNGSADRLYHRDVMCSRQSRLIERQRGGQNGQHTERLWEGTMHPSIWH